MAANGHLRMRNPVPGARGGGLFVSGLQRARGRGQGSPKAWRLTPRGEAVINVEPREAGRRRAGNVSSRRAPRRASGARAGATLTLAGARPPGSDFRLTVRTYKVLAAIRDLDQRGSNPSNREIANAAEVRDQGQISKLLRRLQTHGLLINTGGQTQGIPNAWQLTPKGREIVSLASARGVVPSGAKRETV